MFYVNTFHVLSIKMIGLLIIKLWVLFSFSSGFIVDYRLKDGDGDPLPLYTGLHYAIKNKGTGYYLALTYYNLNLNSLSMYANGPDYQDKSLWFKFYETPAENRTTDCKSQYIIRDFSVCLSKANDDYYYICIMTMIIDF